MNKIKFCTGLNSILTLMILGCGTLLASSIVFADDTDVVDQVSLIVPIACTMTGTGTTHTATLNPGTYSGASGSEYENGIGKTTLTAICNDDNGFSIYAIGYTGNEYGITNLIGSNTNGTIATKAYASGDTSSNWSMKLTKVTDSTESYNPQNLTIQSDTEGAFSSWHSVPASYTKVAEYHANTGSSTTDTTLGVKLETTYAAYIASNQPADTYIGQVKYTMVHPSSATAPIICAPNGTTISTIQCMQDITSTNESTVLASMTEGTQYTLKDKRDGKEYTIAKLADGKVWMTQNLDLDIDSSRTYTNEDTDLGWNTQTNSYQTASWTPSRSTYATATNNIHEWCQGGTWTATEWGGYCEQNNTPESYDPGDLYWNTTTSNYSDWNTYHNSCDFSTSTPSCDESLNPLSTYVSSTGAAQYHLGNYYNWAAAIASNNASIYGVYNENTGEYENLETHQSICPAGWTLPYSTWNDNLGQSEGDFAGLWSEYGWTDNDGFSDISTIWSAPLYFAPAGYFGGRLGDVGGYGGFWSSVARGGSSAHYAYFSVDGDALPAGDDVRYGGYSVRCLLRQPSVSFDDVYAANNKTQINNHYAIQDLDESMCNSVSIGEITTVIDVRDNNTYMIRKMKGGNCWMLENLALDPTDSITAQNMNESNTNATSSAISNLLNGGSSTAGWTSVAIADVDSDFNSCTVPMINNASKDILVTSYGPASTNNQAKVGIYYNFCAASAGTYCYEDGQGVDAPDTLIDASQDLCPANWRMPTSGNDGEYMLIYNKYNATQNATDAASLQYNLSMPFSGHYYHSPSGQNYEGNWWSSTYAKDYDMYRLRTTPSSVYPNFTTDDFSRMLGQSMRCLVAK